MAEVELDEKGRTLIPASIRKHLKTRRFEIRLKEGRIVMEPLPDPESVRGKHRGLLKGKTMEEVEEEQERFVLEGKR